MWLWRFCQQFFKNQAPKCFFGNFFFNGSQTNVTYVLWRIGSLAINLYLERKCFGYKTWKLNFFNFEVCKIDEYFFTKFLKIYEIGEIFMVLNKKSLTFHRFWLSMFSSTTTSVEWRCTSKSSLAGTPSGSSPGFPARIGPKRQKLITKIQKCLNFNEIDVFLDENSNL